MKHKTVVAVTYSLMTEFCYKPHINNNFTQQTSYIEAPYGTFETTHACA